MAITGCLGQSHLPLSHPPPLISFSTVQLTLKADEHNGWK